MSLKHDLLAGVVLIGSALAAQAQTANATNPNAPAAADLFAQPTAKQARQATISAPPSKAPFVVEQARPASGDGATQHATAAKAVDVSALRYYASQNDLARVAAEIRLLRSLHPNWEPPQDLFSDTRSSIDEQPLWDLFGKHDTAGLRAAMDGLREQNPDWQPSAELAQKIQLAEARDQLIAASDQQRWADAVDVAATNRALLTCGDVDSLWRTAEALKQTGDEQRAGDAYRYILTNCDNPAERLATAQKASHVLETPAILDSVIALGKRGRDGRGEFESLRLDGLRTRIGEAAAGKANAPVSASDLDQLAASFKASRAPADAQLLGWYHYSRKEFTEAETWFRAGLAVKADPKSAEGLVLALREEGKMPEALDLAMQDRDLDPANRKVFIQLVSAVLAAPTPALAPKPEQIQAFATAIDAEKDAAGAQAYGWTLFKAKQVAQAEPWFKKSMDWKPSEDAAIGLLISAKQLKHDRVYADLVRSYSTQYPRIAELEEAMRPRGGVPAGGARASRRVARGGNGGGDGGWDSGADAIVKTFQSGQYDQALAMMDTRKATRAEPHGLSVVRGWAQYQRGDWEGARRTFSALEQTTSSGDAEKGLRQIELGYTNPRYR